MAPQTTGAIGRLPEEHYGELRNHPNRPGSGSRVDDRSGTVAEAAADPVC